MEGALLVASLFVLAPGEQGAVRPSRGGAPAAPTGALVSKGHPQLVAAGKGCSAQRVLLGCGSETARPSLCKSGPASNNSRLPSLLTDIIKAGLVGRIMAFWGSRWGLSSFASTLLQCGSWIGSPATLCALAVGFPEPFLAKGLFEGGSQLSSAAQGNPHFPEHFGGPSV